jgi:hypothetical protein
MQKSNVRGINSSPLVVAFFVELSPFFILELSPFLYWSYLPFCGVISLFLYWSYLPFLYWSYFPFCGVISLDNSNIKKGDNSTKREITPI